MWQPTDILHITDLLGSNVDRAQVIRIQYAAANPTITLSCTGAIEIVSIKDGKVIRSYRKDLVSASISVQSDANIPFAIYGNVTGLVANNNCLFDLSQNDTLELLNSANNSLLTSLNLSGRDALTDVNIMYCPNLTSVNLSGCSDLINVNFFKSTSLTTLILSGTYENLDTVGLAYTAIQNLDLSSCENLTTLYIKETSALQVLDFRSAHMTQLNVGNNPNIEQITCRATSSSVATRIATMINNATSTTGDVGVFASDPYASTIATAATNKGWLYHPITPSPQ